MGAGTDPVDRTMFLDFTIKHWAPTWGGGFRHFEGRMDTHPLGQGELAYIACIFKGGNDQ